MEATDLELVRSAVSPVPILQAPFFDQEVIGPRMLDRLGDELFADSEAGAVLLPWTAMRGRAVFMVYSGWKPGDPRDSATRGRSPARASRPGR